MIKYSVIEFKVAIQSSELRKKRKDEIENKRKNIANTFLYK